MSYSIRPLVPFSATERRYLQRWLDSLASRSVDAARRIDLVNDTIVVQADADTTHDVALVAMLELGRPFHYTLVEAPRRQKLTTVGSQDPAAAPVGLTA